MRLESLAPYSMLLAMLVFGQVGCGKGPVVSKGSGGQSGKGGATSSGGAIASGGTTSSGGVTEAGGSQASGGTRGSGGVTSSGGTPGSGGVTTTGGATGTGGSGGNKDASADGSAPADVAQGIDSTVDLGDLGGSDLGGPFAEAGTSEAGAGPGCPAEPPTSGIDCALAADLECTYGAHCTSGAATSQIFWCASGKWTGAGDLGCGGAVAPSNPPPECTGACTAGETRCLFIVELCPANEPLTASCFCASGSWGSCSREYDCYPPSTCVSTAGDCLTTGKTNYSPNPAWCPSGTTMAACTGRPCSPGDVRPACRQGGAPSHSAVCVYGQWACPIGYTGPTPG
jgi:hypothetical protein